MARKIHIQQESDDHLKRALKGRIREHKIEKAKMEDKVYYKKEKEKLWRGPAVVIGRNGKNVIVKHGGLLKELARVHMTRIVEGGGQGEEEEGNTEEISGESEDEEEDNVARMRWRTEEGEEEEREETGEGEWGNVPTMKRGERYEIKSKEDGSVNKVNLRKSQKGIK